MWMLRFFYQSDDLFGCAGSPLLCGLFSLVAVSGGCSLDVAHRPLIAVASPVAEQALGCAGSVVVTHGLSNCSLWAAECGLQ